jgi:parvulin-like peptidyl-prolyl isomerase
MPEITQAEADSAEALGERIRTAVLNGASIDSLQRLYNDPTLDKDASDVSLNRLPPEYQAAIGQLDSGAVVPLFKLPGPVSYRDKYIVLKLVNRRSAGEVKYEDVRDQIRSGLGKDLAVQHYVARLRKNSYVEIRGF